MEFLSYLISGISLGSVYAIIALGYTMVYGIAKMLNFAHGDVIMVGGYISFCAMFYLGLPNIVAVLLAVVVCTVLGIVIERLAYKPLRSAPSLAVLITAIGVTVWLCRSREQRRADGKTNVGWTIFLVVAYLLSISYLVFFILLLVSTFTGESVTLG